MYVDVHCHLDLIKDLDKVLEDLSKNNVLAIGAGINVETNRFILDLTNKNSNTRACLGMYPDEVLKLSDKEIKSELKFIEKNKNKIVGIGEIGLDKTYDDFEKQKKYFVEQLKLAKKLGKVVVIHSRKAEKEVVEILEDLKMPKVIMHCFCGNKKLVEKIVKNGWYISIPANVKFNEQFQENVKLIPLTQLLCETDSPFLHPLKGKRNNTPLNVVESYKKIAEIKDLSLSKIEKQILENYKKVFS